MGSSSGAELSIHCESTGPRHNKYIQDPSTQDNKSVPNRGREDFGFEFENPESTFLNRSSGGGTASMTTAVAIRGLGFQHECYCS